MNFNSYSIDFATVLPDVNSNVEMPKEYMEKAYQMEIITTGYTIRIPHYVPILQNLGDISEEEKMNQIIEFANTLDPKLGLPCSPFFLPLLTVKYQVIRMS